MISLAGAREKSRKGDRLLFWLAEESSWWWFLNMPRIMREETGGLYTVMC